jgi:hypothetical protein
MELFIKLIKVYFIIQMFFIIYCFSVQYLTLLKINKYLGTIVKPKVSSFFSYVYLYYIIIIFIILYFYFFQPFLLMCFFALIYLSCIFLIDYICILRNKNSIKVFLFIYYCFLMYDFWEAIKIIKKLSNRNFFIVYVNLISPYLPYSLLIYY